MAKVFKTSENSLNRVLPRIEASPETGLTSAEAKERFENGYANRHSSKTPKWWWTPTFCGWGEQAHYYNLDKRLGMQRYACKQKFYNEMMAKIREEIENGTFEEFYQKYREILDKPI